MKVRLLLLIAHLMELNLDLSARIISWAIREADYLLEQL